MGAFVFGHGQHRKLIAYITDALRTGSIFLGVYLLVVAAILVFAATIGGHMSPLLLVFPALPWSLLGNLLLASDGLGIGTWVGLALNAVLVFGLGYICQR